jgi:hypothetical protein
MELVELAHVSLDERDLEGGRALLLQSLPLLRELRDVSMVARCLEGVAAVIGKVEPEHALRIFGVVAALREAAGAPLPQEDETLPHSRLAPSRRMLGDERSAAEVMFGRRMRMDDAIELAMSVC